MTTFNRRSLAGAAGLLVTGIARSSKAAALDGDLLHLVDELVATTKAERASLNAMTVEEQGAFHHGRFVQHYVHGIRSPIETLARAIARIPARTPEGIQAKARALLWWQGGSDAGPLLAIGDGLWESLLADMTGTLCRFPSRLSGAGDAT